MPSPSTHERALPAPHAPPPSHAARRSALRALRIAGLAIAWAYPALILLGDHRPYALDVASHFGVHVGATLALVGLALLAARARVGAINSFLAAALLLALTLGAYHAPVSPSPGPDVRRLRLVHYNAKGDRSDRFQRWLREQDPDLVCIVEAPDRFVETTPWIQERYPFRVVPRPGLMWSMVLLSKFPTDHAVILEPQREKDAPLSFLARRSVVVTVDDRWRFLFGGTHPASPRTRQTWTNSIEQTSGDGALVRAWRERTGIPVVVSGDFNSTPAGRVHRAFARASGLTAWSRPCNAGTWHARLPAWLAIPIDKVWTSEGARVTSLRVGPAFDSDHRPIVCEIEIDPPPAPPETTKPPLPGAR